MHAALERPDIRQYLTACHELFKFLLALQGASTYVHIRAVDHEGEVLEVYATKRRDHRAALEFLKRAMKRYGRPATIVTDRLQVIPGCDEGDRQCGRPDLRSLAEQPGGKLTSALPTTGRGNGAVQRHQYLAEILLRPCLDLQPFQPPTPSQPPRYFQTSPSHRLDRMASTCCLRALYYGFFCSGPVSLTARILSREAALF